VLMNKGRILQVDSPKDIYDYPTNEFVASFIGSPRMNFIDAEIRKDANGVHAVFGDELQHRLSLAEITADEDEIAKVIDKKVRLGIRPEHISVAATHADGEGMDGGTADIVEVLGAETNIYVDLVGGVRLIVREFNDVPVHRGDALNLAVQLDKIHIFDAESTFAVTHRPNELPPYIVEAARIEALNAPMEEPEAPTRRGKRTKPAEPVAAVAPMADESSADTETVDEIVAEIAAEVSAQITDSPVGEELGSEVDE